MKDDSASENNVGWMIIDDPKCQGAALSTKDAGWLIVEMANVNTEDGMEQCQWVKLKIRLGVSYVYEAEFAVSDINDFDISLGKRWIHDIKHQYYVDHDTNKIWIANILWEVRENRWVHNLPGKGPLDIDEEIAEQPTVM